MLALGGSTLSATGSALTSFAVISQVFQLTRSSFAVGLVGVAQVVPTLGIGLLGGSVADALSGPVGHISRQGRAMLCAVAVWGTAFAGFAVAPGLWLTLGLLGVAGAAGSSPWLGPS